MPTRVTQPCPHRESTLALGSERLEGDEKRAAQIHLERCEACRSVFRKQTADWFPRFRNYTIIERIGRGGFGEVYRAIQHTKERTEALKVLSERTKLKTAYFQNEVHLVAKLQHPNIATLYEAQLSSTPCFYTMEFVEGQQLDPYLAEHETPLEQRLAIFKSVVEAIGYAHGQGVVHRDLKPQNILIDTNGQPRIVDFGIAKWFDVDGQPLPNLQASPREGAIGTYGYIAPEQLHGGDIDARADIYGLGVLLFHIVTGVAAKRADRTARLAGVLRRRRIARPDDLAAIIARCMKPVPESRYQSTADLARDLDNYLAGRPIEGREDTTLIYRAARLVALALRNAPVAVRAIIILTVTLLLSTMLHSIAARWFVPGAAGGATTLIGLTTETLEKVTAGRIGVDIEGFDPDVPKSWRLLHGRLFEALADAGPRAVVWDFYTPDCQPQFDEALIRGMGALRAPVVVGVHDVDGNGEPRICPEILAAAHSFGVLISPRPLHSLEEMDSSLCMQRGKNPAWLPSLAVAAFAAARFPDSEVYLQASAEEVELRYKRRSAREGEDRWRPDIDRIPVHNVVAVDEPPKRGFFGMGRSLLMVGDTFLLGRVRGAAHRIPPQRRLSYEQVLAADPAQRRAWFEKSVIVIGQLLPGADEYEAHDGSRYHGCEVQAMAIDALLTSEEFSRLRRPWLPLRVGLWCVLGALLVGLVPARARTSLGIVTLVGVSVFFGALVLVTVGALCLTEPWLMEACIALGAILATGGLVLIANAMRRRQLQLAPYPVTSDEESTLPNHYMVETSNVDSHE